LSALALAAGTVAVDPLQREILLEELATLIVSLSGSEAGEPWEDLAVAVDAGEVDEPLLGRLETILEMTLQTGRTRRVHGADGEQSLLRLFHQTPKGAAARRATQAVNETLAGLQGQSLEGALFTVQGPGVFRLGLQTDRCKLTLEIDRHGVSVESLET
jgi:hypothetical protein